MADERAAAREAAWRRYNDVDMYEDCRNLAANPNKWFAAAFERGFDAGAAWQREQDQARPNTEDCMNECAQDYLKTLLQRDHERIRKLESDLRIERGRVESLLDHAALAGEQ